MPYGISKASSRGHVEPDLRQNDDHRPLEVTCVSMDYWCLPRASGGTCMAFATPTLGASRMTPEGHNSPLENPKSRAL